MIVRAHRGLGQTLREQFALACRQQTAGGRHGYYEDRTGNTRSTSDLCTPVESDSHWQAALNWYGKDPRSGVPTIEDVLPSAASTAALASRSWLTPEQALALQPSTIAVRAEQQAMLERAPAAQSTTATSARTEATQAPGGGMWLWLIGGGLALYALARGGARA